MDILERTIGAVHGWTGLPLLALLTVAAAVFVARSRLVPLRYLPTAFAILLGREDREGGPGQISHYQALSIALAATIGMGNIAGVAVAIWIGGPGAVFWMWIAALGGMLTKYFTCSLAVMYRGRDSEGTLQGGPMYVISEGLGPRWKPLAVLFCAAGIFGCLPVFNVNQLTEATREILLSRWHIEESWVTNLTTGVALAGLGAAVMWGGLQRIGRVAAALVPAMVIVYFAAVVGILITNASAVPECLTSIFVDAFQANQYNGDAMLGGAVGGLIVLGFRRATFSNEAGIGTAPMAHGAARTSSPVAEGLVAMLGPAIDTLIVCTLTALAILVTGVDTTGEAELEGVALTARAFEAAYPGWGGLLLLLCILSFGLSSLFSYSYFGSKCASFLIGAKRVRVYEGFYLASVLAGATLSLTPIMEFIDIAFALMAIPTVLSAILLSGKVVRATEDWHCNRTGAVRANGQQSPARDPF